MGVTDDEFGAMPSRTKSDLYAMDQIARQNDGMVLARIVALELARVLMPLLGGRLG